MCSLTPVCLGIELWCDTCIKLVNRYLITPHETYKRHNKGVDYAAMCVGCVSHLAIIITAVIKEEDL